MSLELKIKAATLEFESKYIRRNEKKQLQRARANKSNKFNNLYRHRMDVLRPEARATHLARAFLKGIPYKSAENNAKDFCENFYTPVQKPVFDRIVTMASKYKTNSMHNMSTEQIKENVKSWMLTSN